METRHEIREGWTLSFTHPVTKERHRIPATVPGNVEIDLQREGLIGDPHPADEPNAMRAWELVDDWVYETVFDAPPSRAGEKVDLVFEGIDTIADVLLNGQQVLRCENMFIPHTVDVTGKLKITGNSLSIRIFSPGLYARRFTYSAAQVMREHRQEQAYLRKARHMWGWDHAPRLVSAGPWRLVVLVVRSPIRFAEVYVYTQKVMAETASIGVNWTIETPDLDLTPYRVKMLLSFGGQAVKELDFDAEFTAGRFVFSIPISAARLWWPRGYGEANLHDLTLVLCRGGEVIAEWKSRFGIREIELVRTDTTNEKGEGEFVFRCNGEKIYVRGTNWKPLDALHSRAAGKVRRALDLCLDLNCNMVRVWGGGVYEDHEFFDTCDRAGLLVWQDFMFGCEFPPQDEFFLEAVAREAEIVVKRLRNHPSLAVWCGDNENDMTVFWGLFIPPAILPSHNLITRKVLRGAVLTHDPYRPYVESSPYISDAIAAGRWAGRATGDEETARMYRMAPEMHIYATGKEDFPTHFRQVQAHFVSETGPFFINAMSESPDIVARETARMRRLWDVDLATCSDFSEYHQRDGYFLLWKDRVRKHCRRFFGQEFPLDALADLTLAVNIVCGDIFKFAIEYSRIRKWRKTGVIWWSLLDMWPMMFNYSVVDSNFRKKQPTYGWIRQSQQALCLMAEESADGGQIAVHVANDTLEEWRGRYRVHSVGADGTKTERAAGEFLAERNATSTLATLPHGGEQALLLMEWTTVGMSGANHFVCGKPPYSLEVFRNWCACLDQLYAAP